MRPDWDAELAASIWKQLPHAGKLNRRDKDYIINRASELSGSIRLETLRAAMKAYANAVQEKPLPLAPFWANPLKWISSELPQERVSASGGYLTLAEPTADAPRPASASAPRVSAVGGIPVSSLIERWNELCPAAPATERIVEGSDWSGCESLPEMVQAWEIVAAKAQSVRDTSDAGWLTLPFLLRTKPGLAKANWQRLLAGDFDPREKRGKDDTRAAMAEWLEAIEAIEKEWLAVAHESSSEVEERRRAAQRNDEWRQQQESAYMEQVEQRRQRFIADARAKYVEQVVTHGAATTTLARLFDADMEAQKMVAARLAVLAHTEKGKVQ